MADVKEEAAVSFLEFEADFYAYLAEQKDDYEKNITLIIKGAPGILKNYTNTILKAIQENNVTEETESIFKQLQALEKYIAFALVNYQSKLTKFRALMDTLVKAKLIESNPFNYTQIFESSDLIVKKMRRLIREERMKEHTIELNQTYIEVISARNKLTEKSHFETLDVENTFTEIRNTLTKLRKKLSQEGYLNQ